VTPEEIARTYFGRMCAGERVDDMFTDDAELRGFGNRVTGKAAIAEMYKGVQDTATPQPEIVDITTAGNRAFGEARVALADGTSLHVVDVFEIEDDLIKSLTYFNADYPPLGDNG
jgi:limonene-1,2-epoxide hydrolase